VCPTCGKVSVSFDPFTSLQLAVPLKTNAVIRIVYVHPVINLEDKVQPPILLSINIDMQKSCKVLKIEIVENLRNQTGIHVDNLNIELFEIGSDRLPMSLVRNSNLISEVTGGVLFAYLKNPEHDMNSIIFNRTISVPVRENCDGNVQVQLGFPIFMSFNSDWSASKIRFHIWLQV
jgi:hypothetical protein